jgi:hypothetical protein
MNIRMRFIAPVLAGGAIAAAIAAAPGAAAAPGSTCSNGGGATICQRPGHAAIDAAPPQVSPPRSYGQFASPLPFLYG